MRVYKCMQHISFPSCSLQCIHHVDSSDSYVIHSNSEAIAHDSINIQRHKHLILHKLAQILHLLPTFPLG